LPSFPQDLFLNVHRTKTQLRIDSTSFRVFAHENGTFATLNQDLSPRIG
jgi:hypothetical protein